MDSARTIIDGVGTNYYYHEFAVIQESERERLKPFLHCPTCKAKATFRRASVSGAQAHFSLRSGEEHEDGCDEVKYENDTHKSKVQREDDLLRQEVEKVKNDNNVIEIITSGKALFEGDGETGSVDPKKTPQEQRTKTSTSKTHAIESTNTRASEKDLIKLLKYCMRTTRLLTESDIVLKFRGMNYQVKNSIFNFFNIQQISNTRRPYFFWGSVKFVKDLTYLNVGQGANVSVIIDNSIREQLWEMMRVNVHWQLVGCNLICFGWAKKKNNLTYIIIKNVDDIAFLGVKPNKNYLEPSKAELPSASPQLLKSELSSELVQSEKPDNQYWHEHELALKAEEVESESPEKGVIYDEYNGDSHFPTTSESVRSTEDEILPSEVDEAHVQKSSAEPLPTKDSFWQKVLRFFS